MLSEHPKTCLIKHRQLLTRMCTHNGNHQTSPNHGPEYDVQWRSGVFTNFEQVSHLILVFLLLTLSN